MKDKIKTFENEISIHKSIENDKSNKICEATIKCQELINESNLHKCSIEDISKEKLELNSKLQRLELEFVKRGQTEQTIHQNLSKVLKMFDNKDGLGFENPKYLSKAISKCCSLYDYTYMKLGIIDKMVFVRPSDEMNKHEDDKHKRDDKRQIPFDYTKLNIEYLAEKPNFKVKNENKVLSKESSTDCNPMFSSEQTTILKPSKVLYYTPTLLLEKHIEELQIYVFQLTIDHEIETSVLQMNNHTSESHVTQTASKRDIDQSTVNQTVTKREFDQKIMFFK